MYKALTPSKETEGALDVKEDHHVQLEVPVDQVGIGSEVHAAFTPSQQLLPASASSLTLSLQILSGL